MSRDFTPREQTWADFYSGNKLSKMVISLSSNNGTEVVCDPNEALAKEYPNLYFLAQDLLKRCLKNKNAKSVVKEIETVLSSIIKKDKSGDGLGEMVSGSKEPEHTVCLWYMGLLDQGFYYADENNERFYSFIEEYKRGKKSEENS